MKSAYTLEILINSTLESIKHIIPYSFSAKPLLSSPSLIAQQVHIDILGDFKGTLIINENGEVFSKLGESMFGMLLEGEMLQSFMGEFGNMVAGQLATIVSQKGLNMDITPPLVAQMDGYPNKTHYCTVPVELENGGELHFSFFLNELAEAN
ncbi:chemotaxis protein CheX [Metabacillus sp. RGM 3146]|uniref:chemotaxis protein CheX n=1 Tax=Metabacillus sp. RGM 3146 TaxID=3401092 RepID=UPI003B9ACFBF